MQLCFASPLPYRHPPFTSRAVANKPVSLIPRSARASSRAPSSSSLRPDIPLAAAQLRRSFELRCQRSLMGTDSPKEKKINNDGEESAAQRAMCIRADALCVHCWRGAHSRKFGTAFAALGHTAACTNDLGGEGDYSCTMHCLWVLECCTNGPVKQY